MRTFLLSFASLALVLFSAPITSAQSLDGKVEAETDSTATYGYDNLDRKIRESDDEPNDNARTYDERDLKLKEGEAPEFEGEPLPGEGQGGSIDPLNNPEMFQQLQKCPDCETIKKELEDAKKDLKDLEKAKGDLDEKIKDAEKSVKESKDTVDEAKKALEDFQNPKSYAESEGSRMDSSDLDAKRWAYGNAWTAYQNGVMTGSELQDFWENFDDADLAKAKQGYEKQLKKDIEKAEKALADAKAKKERLEDQKAKLEKALESTKKKVKKLEKKLEDCLKKCGPSIFGSFFDIFNGIGKPDVSGILDHTQGLLGLPLPLPPEPILPPAPEGFQADSFFDIFYEIKPTEDPKKLTEEEKKAVEERVGGGQEFQVDSFFDITFELDFPTSSIEDDEEAEMLPTGLVAACPKCQSILDEINSKKKAIGAMQNSQKVLQAKSGKLDKSIAKAQGRVDNLKAALDRMENPKSWAESEGRRVDSADLEARRAAFANAWGQYQGGQMTAQQLEDYWNNFDDAERDKWKQKVKDQLKQKIKDTEKIVKDLKADKQKVEKEISDLQKEIEKAENEIKQLEKDYEECVKKCKDANTPPNLMDGLGDILKGLMQDGHLDPKVILEKAVELLVSPPVVLPAPADDVAPEDDAETESRMIVFEDLNIQVGKGETIEFTLPTTQEKLEYLVVKMEDVIISETSRDDEVVVNPNALLPKPELSTDGKGNLTISNIGSSGEDGVEIDLDDTHIKDQLLNPNPNGDDYLKELEVDTSGIGGLGGAQVIGFDQDGKRVILRDNVRITPNADGGAHIEFGTPITVSPGRPIDIVMPAEIKREEEAELKIDLPSDQFLPSEVDEYRFETGPQGGTLNGPGTVEGTGIIFLPESGSSKPSTFRFDPNGERGFEGDFVFPDRWGTTPAAPAIPPIGFDPLSDLQQGFQNGNTTLDTNGNLVVSNIGSSGEDGVRIDLGSGGQTSFGDNLGSSGEDGIQNNNYGQIGHGGIVNVNEDGTFTYDPPKNSFGSDRLDHTQAGGGSTDFFDPFALQFPNLQTLPSLEFGIIGPNTFIPLDPSGIDGRPGISVQDLSGLNQCINQGGPSCNGLDVGPPSGVGGTPFSGGINPSDFEIIAGLPNGGDFDWQSAPGNEGGGLWNADGPNASRPVTGNFFDAQNGTLQGSGFDDQGGGGIFNNGGGIFVEGGTNGDFQFFGNDGPGGLGNGFLPKPPPGNPHPYLHDSGLESNNGSSLGGELITPDTPPAPPTTSSLPPQVQALIRRIIQENPPGPCDELILDVTRVRVGNKFEFTITARMQKKPNCPPKDTIIGDPGEDTILGEPGDDILIGSGGNDRINGTGDDLLDGPGNGLIDTAAELFPNLGSEPDNPGDPEARDTINEGIHPDGPETAPQCPGELTLGGCTPGCKGNEECVVGATTGGANSQPCYYCVEVEPETSCPAGSFPQSGCNCDSNEICTPINRDNLCWECMRKANNLPLPAPSCQSNSDCNDGDACTEDFCKAGDCINRDRNLDDGDECSTGFCNPENGEITHTPIPGCGEPEPTCPHGSFERSGCTSCDAGCEPVPNAENLECFKCKEPEDEVVRCSENQFEDSNCNNSCNSNQECKPGLSFTVSCYECVNKPQDDPPPTPQCPSGTTADRAGCNEACSNGVCLQTATAGETACVQCYQCPSGMFTDRDSCESESGQACEVGATSGSMQCWRPMPSCEDACTQHGFSASPIDFTAEVESQLNAVSCVSSYQMQIQQATVGNCTCHPTQAPQITFDRTPPVCKDTACGDVACGESTSCATGENQTTTVTCNWGGWQKEALYKYRPILGGQ